MKKYLLIVTTVLSLNAFFTSCRNTNPDHDSIKVDDDANDAGDDVEKAGNDVGNSIDKAANKTGNAIDKAAHKTGDAIDKSANKVNDELNGTDDN